MLPLIVTMVVTSAAAGFVISKTGNYKVNIVAGWVFWTVALGLMSTFDKHSSTGMIAGSLLLAGVGSGQTGQTTVVAIQASVDRKDMAVATGLRNFVRMLFVFICALRVATDSSSEAAPCLWPSLRQSSRARCNPAPVSRPRGWARPSTTLLQSIRTPA
jgi:hypothetical protein